MNIFVKFYLLITKVDENAMIIKNYDHEDRDDGYLS